jgi:hypothetical protein
MAADEELLRRLAIHDPRCVDDVLSGEDVAAHELDPKVLALVRLAGLISVDAPDAALLWGVAEALGAGASSSEVVGALVALGPTLGSVRLVASAPRLALALGWDIDAALEGRGQAVDPV